MVKISGRVLVILQVAAYWPVAVWYVRRTVDRSVEPWGLLATGAACYFLWRWRKPGTCERMNIWFPTAMAGLYLAGFRSLPPVVLAVLATVAVSATLCQLSLGRPFHLGIWGLFGLGLPVIPTLQFFAGFPMRVATAAASIPILGLFGIEPERVGTGLRWAGEIVLVDAPCSGIRMLWSGLFLTYLLACVVRVKDGRLLGITMLALCLIFGANVVRATALFFLEANLIHAPAVAHSGIGVLVFFGMAWMLFAVTMRLGTPLPCAVHRSV